MWNSRVIVHDVPSWKASSAAEGGSNPLKRRTNTQVALREHCSTQSESWGERQRGADAPRGRSREQARGRQSAWTPVLATDACYARSFIELCGMRERVVSQRHSADMSVGLMSSGDLSGHLDSKPWLLL